MKRLIIIYFFLTLPIQLYIQEIKLYSFSFDKTPLKEVFTELESKTDYNVYFIEDWIKDKVISKNFTKLSIDQIMDDLLKETSLNFEIVDEKIILTLGNMIITELPDNYFSEKTSPTQEKSQDPIFFRKDVEEIKKGIETVIISKQNANDTKKTYQLTGRAIEKNTGNPVASLTIQVKGTNTFAVTDFDGNYSINLNRGENMITAQAMGMNTLNKRIVLYNDGEYDFILTESLESLSEVLINTSAQANVRETLTGVSRIEIQDIKNIPLVLGERDILKVATTLPGISSAGEGAIGFNVRGGKADQNLFLLDGASIYNPTHFFGIFSAINPFTTDAAQIYKGSIPAKYGGRLASVFEISTKDASKEEFKGEVSIGPVTGNITLETPVVKDKSSLIVGARATYSDWILNNLDDPVLKNSEASFYDVIAKYSHKIDEKNNLRVTGYYSGDLFNITIDSVYSYTNMLASVNWDREINEKTRSNLKLAHSQYQFGIEFEGRANNNFDFGFDLQETEISYGLNHLINDKHRLEAGLSSKLYSINPGRIEPIGEESIVLPFAVNNERGLESAIYFSDDWTLSEKISINAGLRFSIFNFLGETTQRTYSPDAPLSDASVIGIDEFGENEIVETYAGPEIRVSGRYLFNPSLSLKAAYNSTLQYIHTLSNNTTASPIDTWKLSDRFIEPQRSEQYSLGLFKNLNGTKYELSVEGYYKNLENTLDYKVGGQLILNEFVETEVLQGDGKSYGVELLMKKNEGDLNGYLGYSYSRTFYRLDSEFSEERVNRGEYFPANFDIPHELSLVLNYKLTKRYSFSGNFIYQTGRPVTFPIGAFQEGGNNYVLFGDRNQFRIPDYFRVDLGINIEGNHRIKKFAHSFWNISVYNVLGRNNPYSTFFVTENGQVKAFQSSIFTVPIPTITYNFKF
jgi:hypothetical protein